MPGLVKRRFPVGEGLRYDSSSDTLYLLEGFRGADPIVAVRRIIGAPGVVQLNDMQAFDTIQLTGPAIVKGSLLAGIDVTIKADKPVLVAGDIGTASRSLGENLRNRVVIEGSGPEAHAVVLGSILSRSVEVKAPTIVIGDVLGLEAVEIDAPTLILGRVVSGSENTRGRIYVRHATAYQLYATGDIHIDEGVSVFLPLIAAKKGKVTLNAENVRVVSFPCIFCAKAPNPLICTRYLEGSCPSGEDGYDHLYSDDYTETGDYTMLSWYWRSSPLMIVQNMFSKKLLYTALEIKQSLNIDPASMTVNGTPLNEYPHSILAQLASKLRAGTAEALADAKQAIFDTVEEYFKANNIDYTKCPHCGAPNPTGTKICLHCGREITPRK